MSKFDYPRLPRHDIIVVLSDSQIAAVSEADLLRPDPEFIYKLYTHILVHMDILKDDQGQMEFEAMEHLENPEHHSHSVQIMNMFVKLRQLLAAINCPKAFTPKDLIKPDPDRTEFFLGALLNFHLHRHTKMDLLQPIFVDLELFEQQKLSAEARILELNMEIAELEELREKELPLVQEVSFKIKELHQNVDELNKHQATLRTTIKQLKEKGKETDEKISNAEFALVQSVQENASLRSKIVQSPDKLQRALEETKLALAEAKDAERAAIKSFQDKTAKLEAYAKACKKMSRHFGQMQAVQELVSFFFPNTWHFDHVITSIMWLIKWSIMNLIPELFLPYYQQVNSAKSVEKDVKVLKSKLSDEDVLIKSLEAKLVELQSKADQLKEFKRQVEKERAVHHEEADKELNNVEFEVESKRHALELRQRQVESVVAEADAINLKKKNVREEAEATIRELGRKSEEIVSEFDKYSKSISNLLASGGQDQHLKLEYARRIMYI